MVGWLRVRFSCLFGCVYRVDRARKLRLCTPWRVWESVGCSLAHSLLLLLLCTLEVVVSLPRVVCDYLYCFCFVNSFVWLLWGFLWLSTFSRWRWLNFSRFFWLGFFNDRIIVSKTDLPNATIYIAWYKIWFIFSLVNGILWTTRREKDVYNHVRDT